MTRVSVSKYYHYTVSQKTVQNCFCQHFLKFPPILIIFGRKMAKRLKLYAVHCEMEEQLHNGHAS